MGTSQPIRSLDELTAFRSYYLNKEVNLRIYMLICMGLITALRISDMLQLKWGNVYDFDRKHYVKHIVVCEGKTGKETRNETRNKIQRKRHRKRKRLAIRLSYRLPRR